MFDEEWIVMEEYDEEHEVCVVNWGELSKAYLLGLLSMSLSLWR